MLLSRLIKIARQEGEGTVRGQMYDSKREKLCPAAVVLLDLEDQEGRSEFEARPNNTSLSRDTPEARVLTDLTQFEADDLIVGRLDLGRWAVAGPCIVTDAVLAEEPTAERVLGLEQDLKSLSANDAVIVESMTLFGAPGPTLVAFLLHLDNMDSFGWDCTRRRACREFTMLAPLARNDAAAGETARKVISARLLMAAQYWARTLAFRRAFDHMAADLRDPNKSDAAFEWDTAWLAWAADLARRAAVEIIALSSGRKPAEDIALRFFGVTYSSLKKAGERRLDGQLKSLDRGSRAQS